jgi:hypothetical protein
MLGLGSCRTEMEVGHAGTCPAGDVVLIETAAPALSGLNQEEQQRRELVGWIAHLLGDLRHTTGVDEGPIPLVRHQVQPGRHGVDNRRRRAG